MKSFRIIACLAAILFSAASFAQSAAEISAAKSMARAYGYSESEINAVLNHNIGGSSASGQVRATSSPVTSGATTIADATVEDVASVTVISAAEPARPVSSDAIFGHDYFKSEGLAVIPSYNAPTPASYVLGPGDDVIIDIWGATNSHVEATIGNDGSISAFELGPVYLAGMSVKNAESVLKSQLGRIYSGLNGSSTDTYLRLSVGKIKGVVVSILGEVAVPGAYTIPSLASITSAIFMAGGVKETGSVRNIALYRNGRKVSSFDLYEFIFRGKFDENLRLQDNDVISVQPCNTVVSISGAVIRDMRYEMKEGETVKDLLEYAGGFTTNAQRDELHVRRKGVVVGDAFDVKEAEFGSFKLQDGDAVSVRSNSNSLANRVTISGPVMYPGAYAISSSVSDVAALIKAAGGLREGAYTGRGQINRLDENRLPVFLTFNLEKVMKGEEKVALQREDKVTLFSQDEFVDQYNVSVSGYVMQPDTFPFNEGMTVADAIILARGVKDEAFAARGQIYRIDRQGVPQMISFDVKEALEGNGNVPLFRGDEVRVYSINELRQNATVSINGQVKAAGTFAYREGLTIQDVVMMAGGLTNGADLRNVEISGRGGRERGKVDVYDIEENPELMATALKPYDVVNVKRLTYFKAQTTVTVEGEVITPGTYVVDKAEVRLSDIFERVGGFTDEAYPHGARLERRLTEEEIERQRLAVMIANQNLTGRDSVDLTALRNSYAIGIELDKALADPGSKYDIVLRPGDVITVPGNNSTVKVSGGVFYPNVLTYEPGMSWKQYVYQAGGFTKDARKGKSYMVYMNGKVATAGHNMKVEPGAEIIVPERSREHHETSPAEIAAIASSTTSIATLAVAIIRMFM